MNNLRPEITSPANKTLSVKEKAMFFFFFLNKRVINSEKQTE